MSDQPVRVLLAKIGLDGHDRGLRLIARILRDGGCEVIYAGLRQTPAMIAATVIQEDVDVVGLSMHNGAHMTLVSDVLSALRAEGLSTPLIVGGIIPKRDHETLLSAGVVAILGPGTPADQVVAAVKQAGGTPPAV